jgi:DNA-binding transcriptional ArsR family regulator
MAGERKERRATREEMRALAHPLRLRMIELLREGPATASRLARRVGESTGSTSYHLRVLERAGLIAEDGALGNGRERWWRRTVPLLYVPIEDDVEGRALAARVRSIFFQRDDDARRRFAAGEAELDRDWARGSFIGSWYVELSAEEADELGRRVMRMVDELRRPRDERPEGARRVLVSFSALPWLDM